MADIANAKDEVVLVTAHDVVNLLFCYVAEGMDESSVLDRSKNNGLKNAAICRLQVDDSSPTGWVVTAYNIDEHLVDEGITVTDQPGASDGSGPTRRMPNHPSPRPRCRRGSERG